MERSVTVSVRGLLVAGLVVLGLAVAYLLGNGTASVPAAAGATGNPSSPGDPAGDPAAEPRTLTMRGTGEAVVVPDQAAFDVRVRLVRDDLATALDDGNALLARVLRGLDELGIPKGDVETTGLGMSPVYSYSSSAPPVLEGYRVSQSVTVLVKDLKVTGEAISGVVETGGNAVRVGGIELRVGDPEAAIAQARTRAVDDATAKAEEYAAATGAGLGGVRTLVEVDPQSTVSQVRDANAELAYRSAAYDALSAVPIRTGRSDLSVTVQVVWDLAD